MQPTTETDRPQRILEIEGLRAVAAGLVLVFHAWVGGVSGGVDVFFVVAGFLVTRTLLRQLDGAGVRAGQFLLGLVRRLLPAVIVVVIAICGVALLLRPRVTWGETLEQAIASLTYWQNWWLADASVDYLAPDQSRSFFQHFWALSMQGQFALAWLLIFLLIALIARLSRLHPRHVALAVVSVVVVASFAFGLWQTSWSPEWAYFDTRGRIWEYGAGALVALLPRTPGFSRALAGPLSWLALCALLGTGFVATGFDLRFPGVVALLPVGAAVLLLLCLRGPSWSANAMLRSRPLVWLGGISYGIYLWHWPLLIAAQSIRGTGPIGPLSGAAIVGGSVLLAWITTRLIEQPLRQVASRSAAARGRIEGSLIGGIVGATTLGLVAWGVGASAISSPSDPSSAPLETSQCWGMAALDEEAECAPPPPGEYLPAGDPREDHPEINGPCVTNVLDTELVPCTYGDADSSIRIAHIGNSHSGAWFPALKILAEEHGWRLDVYMKSACTYNGALRPNDNTEALAACEAWNTQLTAYLPTVDPYDLVVTSSDGRHNEFVGADGRATVEVGIRGYLQVWEPLVERGADVLVIADYPVTTAEVIECALLDPAADCSLPREEVSVPADEQTIVLAAYALEERGAVVDLGQAFCPGGRCPAVIGNVYVYKDPSHLTATIAQTIAPLLGREMQALEIWPGSDPG